MNILLNILVISGGVLGCVMSLAIVTTPLFKSKANNYLAVSIFVLTIIMFFGWLNATSGLLRMIYAMMWDLLIPATLLSYFLTHIDHTFFKSRYYKLVYVPFVISLVVDVILEFDFSMNWYKLPFDRNNGLVLLYFEIEKWLAVIANIFVMVWSRILVKRSIVDRNVKHWLLRLNLLLLGIVFLWLSQELLSVFSVSTFSPLILWASIALLMWVVLYFGVFKLQIAIEHNELHQILENLNGNRRRKAVKPAETIFVEISNDEQSPSNLINQFIQLFEEEECYKDPLLSRLDLAKKLNLSEGYLSQRVNQELGKSVVQVINEYRIAEAKKLLQNRTFDKYSIDAIGMEAGFKSKSAFYDTFKASTGVSPGTFRKKSQTS